MIRRRGDGPFRCAIYTRVSTAGQAEGDFSSIDNQRESAEAYIKSQAESGWSTVSTRYDDAGWSGSNVERPALRQLLSDVAAGHIDVVVVYKIDRLSRSLLDFAQLIDRIEKAGASLVSVTQQFDTSSSMGKLTMNMLLSFAQFEREMIAERTRDKILAARRRGKWTGGLTPLGYDLVDGQLVVNEAEAERVRQLFELYLEHRSLTAVVRIARDRRWRSKSWTTKTGSLREGREFTSDSMRRLLTNPVYVGRILSGDEVCEGQHDAIVRSEMWNDVKALVEENGSTGGRANRNRSAALLKGLIRCAHCGTAMTPTHTIKGAKRYAYYTCVTAQKRGWASCPSKSVAARLVEGAVIEQIRRIARDPELIEATVEAAVAEHRLQIERHGAEVAAVQADVEKLAREEGRLAAALTRGGQAAEAAERELAAIEERRATLTKQLSKVETAAPPTEAPDTAWLRRTLASFEPVWDALEPVDRANVARLLIAEVVYDGEAEDLEIALRVDSATAGEEAA